MLIRTTLLIAGIGALALCASAIKVYSKENQHWRDARWDSVGEAPAASDHPDAIVMVYGARAHSWRGIFGIHTWIAWKAKGGDTYLRADVVGWGVSRGANAIRVRQGTPDNFWAGNPPFLIGSIQGEAAQAAIPKIEAAIQSYPYNNRYRIWPGPNSNSFTAHVIRNVPELQIDMPPQAVGKDYLGDTTLASAMPSNTGYQLSLWGLAGIGVALDEGLEINLLGLTFGIDITRPAIKLPGIGRIGFPNQ